MLLPAPPSAAPGRRVVALGSAETTLIDPQTSCCSHVLRSIHCASCIPSTNFWQCQQCQQCQTLDGEASARTFPSKLRWDWTFACLIGFSHLDQWNGCRPETFWNSMCDTSLTCASSFKGNDVSFHHVSFFLNYRYGSKDVKTLADPWDLCFDPNMVNYFEVGSTECSYPDQPGWSSMVPSICAIFLPIKWAAAWWWNISEWVTHGDTRGSPEVLQAAPMGTPSWVQTWQFKWLIID